MCNPENASRERAPGWISSPGSDQDTRVDGPTARDDVDLGQGVLSAGVRNREIAHVLAQLVQAVASPHAPDVRHDL